MLVHVLIQTVITFEKSKTYVLLSEGNVEFVAQNRCGPYERNIISDGKKYTERGLLHRVPYTKYREKLQELFECMRVVL